MSEPGKPAAPGARGTAREASRRQRFYTQASIQDEGDGRVSLRLDGKPVRTPAKAQLILPNRALAEAVAAEWQGQGEHIDPASMPLTRLANSVIDGIVGREQAVIDDILSFANADLVCYRAEGPQGLVQEQTKHWDPIIAWAKQEFGVPFKLAQGVTHVAQAEASLDALKRLLAPLDAWNLAALHVMTGLSGSALLALAVAAGRLSPRAAWDAAHVDEDWQIRQWGEDAEARLRREHRWRDFAAAAHMLNLLRG